MGNAFNNSVQSTLLLLHLVRTPVPHGGHGHAQDYSRPGQVRGHRVTEYVKGIITRDSTGGVGHSDGGNSLRILVQDSLKSPNLCKT